MMNANDMHTHRAPNAVDDFGFPSVSPMHAFAIATVSGGFFYYNYLRNNKLLTAPQPSSCAPPAAAAVPAPNKDLSRPLITACTGAFLTAPPAHLPHRLSTLQPIEANDLILIDSSYRQRLAYRRHLLLTHPTQTTSHLPAAAPSLAELHTYLFSHHLPRRFPAYFTLTPSGVLLQNHTSSNTYPIVPQSPALALRALAENIDEDFILLQPDAADYRVSAFAVCAPAGYSLDQKLGCALREVGRGVEGGLAEVLAGLEPGVENALARWEWTVVPDSELFCLKERWGKAWTVERACLRVERQTLWKLPGTGAVVLGVKTYITPLKQLKTNAVEAGRLRDAVVALDGEAARGKRAELWRDEVLAYLS